VPQAGHLGEGSPGATALSSLFTFGFVTCFRMKVACAWHTQSSAETRRTKHGQ
jgi:hypothetical protein